MERLLSHARNPSEVAITIACAVVMAGTLVLVALALYAAVRGHIATDHPAQLVPSVQDCMA